MLDVLGRNTSHLYLRKIDLLHKRPSPLLPPTTPPKWLQCRCTHGSHVPSRLLLLLAGPVASLDLSLLAASLEFSLQSLSWCALS
jgi:hypothetical protein